MKTNLEVIGRILGVSTLFGMALALVWYGAFVSGLACRFQQFGLTQHECEVATYGGIGLVKLLTYTLFLGPWVAIKLELRRHKRSS